MREELMNWGIKVLDHGKVQISRDRQYSGELTPAVYGTDFTVVDSARLSYKGGKNISDDETLLRYLMRHKHWSPFEQCFMRFELKMPIFVARQLVRHRTFAINEMSARYTELPEEFYMPALETIKSQSKSNKQGRGDEVLPDPQANAFLANLEETCEDAFEVYRCAMKFGVARELARVSLPLSTYTEWVWSANLRNILHFLTLRLDQHAQWEIQQYAGAMAHMVHTYFPLTYKAFTDYILGAMTLSVQEQQLLRKVVDNASGLWCDSDATDLGMTKREIDEFRHKLSRLFIN